MFTTTQGIVLRETNYKEADKILTVLTWDQGRRTVKARGCRRKTSKLTAASQLLVYSEMTLFEHREFYTLNEAQTLEQFWGVRQDIILLSLASYFAELMETCAEEGVPNPALLSLLLNSLYALDKLKKPPELVKSAFELKLLSLTGYEPLLEECAVCGRKVPIDPRLNLSAGVLHCAGCREQVAGGVSMPLTPGALAAVRHIVWGDPKKLFSFTLDSAGMRLLGSATEAFLMTQLERGFHTLDFYKQLYVGDRNNDGSV